MIGNAMRLLVAATAIGMCLAPCITAKASDPVTCPAFNKRGDAATVMLVERKLNLQINPAGGGQSFALSASTDDDGLLGCSVFFDTQNRYVAVGVNHLGLKTGPLNIAVADLMTHRFVSSFVVQPNADIVASPMLVGFLLSGPTLAVLGTGGPDHPSKSFSTTLFRINGEQERPSETRTLPADAASVGNVSFADSSHNRLWFKSSPQFCALRSMPLTGNGTENAAVDEGDAKAACDVGYAIAYPNLETLITAVSRDSGDLVTRVELAQHKVDQIVLPNSAAIEVTHLWGVGHCRLMGRFSQSPESCLRIRFQETLTSRVRNWTWCKSPRSSSSGRFVSSPTPIPRAYPSTIEMDP